MAVPKAGCCTRPETFSLFKDGDAKTGRRPTCLQIFAYIFFLQMFAYGFQDIGPSTSLSWELMSAELKGRKRPETPNSPGGASDGVASQCAGRMPAHQTRKCFGSHLLLRYKGSQSSRRKWLLTLNSKECQSYTVSI